MTVKELLELCHNNTFVKLVDKNGKKLLYTYRERAYYHITNIEHVMCYTVKENTLIIYIK